MITSQVRPFVLVLGAALVLGCRADIKPPPPVDVDPNDGGTGDTRGDATGDAAGDRAELGWGGEAGDLLGWRDLGPGDAGTDDGRAGDAGGPADGSGIDATAPDLAVDLAPDAPPLPAGCGTGRPDLSGITNVDGLTIGKDGTIYFTQGGAMGGFVGRLRPGAPAEPRWVPVPQGGMLWGLATDSARQRLYLSSASGNLVYFVALDGTPPLLRVFSRDVHEPDDLAVSPNGTVWFADSDDKLYRVTSAGDLFEVTARSFSPNRPAGLALGAAGDLLVGTLGNGPIYRVTVSTDEEVRERARAVVGAYRGYTEGLALDQQGRIYLTNQPPTGDGQVLRLQPDGSAPTPLAAGPGLRSLVFGRGALDCRDLYVASLRGPLLRVSTGAFGAPIN